MNWIITTGFGLVPHSMHPSLDVALRAVHRDLLRGRGFDSIKFEATTGDDNGASDGTLTMLSWYAPSRTMTKEEIDAKVASKEISRKTAAAWKKVGVTVTDWERTHRIVEFLGEPTELVSICREDRHRQYLARAAQCNDVRDRVAQLDEMTKPLSTVAPRKVLPQK